MRTAVIIPCFNEAGRLPVECFAAEISARPDWTWIFVNNGSQDGTQSVLESLVRERSNALTVALPRNLGGKAEAVRQGVLRTLESGSLPEWIGYLDADLATPISELARLAQRGLERPDLSAVLGSRWPRLGARIERHPLRHYLGRIAATAISLVLGLPTYDTQCGAKLFRPELARDIFAAPFHSRWLFDVELIARCRNSLGQKRFETEVLEEPLLVWTEKGGSKLRALDLLWLPAEIWQIHRRYTK